MKNPTLHILTGFVCFGDILTEPFYRDIFQLIGLNDIEISGLSSQSQLRFETTLSIPSLDVDEKRRLLDENRNRGRGRYLGVG